jgi:phosphomannomutase
MMNRREVKLSCFKAYDVRGELGEELNEGVAYRIGRSFGEWLVKKYNEVEDRKVVVGGDVRLTSKSLKLSLADGLQDAGVGVLDLGVTGTEEIYFATFYSGAIGGVEVTASHNPINFNGMKLVQEGARPISGDSGLNEIKNLAESGVFAESNERGTYECISYIQEYINHLLSYIDVSKILPLKVVINSGNGAAGAVLDSLIASFDKAKVPLTFVKVNHDPDGTFPNGIPNPLLPECRVDTINAVKEHGADLGIAWDGDFDRCFLFDENGKFIEGYYIVGLLAESFLSKHKNAAIIHDPRLIWNTVDIVHQAGGYAVQSKTGHAFIKERMRQEDAVYGGEMSAHHYFKDFAYCDSGMIPWLLIVELLSKKGKPLSKLVVDREEMYPCSGEINFKVDSVNESIERIKLFYQSSDCDVDSTDGLSMAFQNWRFNLRASNTEPLLRLNVETRQNKALLKEKVKEISSLL